MTVRMLNSTPQRSTKLSEGRAGTLFMTESLSLPAEILKEFRRFGEIALIWSFSRSELGHSF